MLFALFLLCKASLRIFFSVLWIENLGCLDCVERTWVSIWMRYEFIWVKKIKVRLTVGEEYGNYFVSINMIFKTMKGGKSGPEKYYYFLLPNSINIQVGAQYSTRCER